MLGLGLGLRLGLGFGESRLLNVGLERKTGERAERRGEERGEWAASPGSRVQAPAQVLAQRGEGGVHVVDEGAHSRVQRMVVVVERDVPG